MLKKIVQHKGKDDNTWRDCNICDAEYGELLSNSRIVSIEVPDAPKPVDLLRAALTRVLNAGITFGKAGYTDAQLLEYARAWAAFDDLCTPENLA